MRNHLLAGLGVVLGVMLVAGTASAASGALQEYTEVLGYDDLGTVNPGEALAYSHTFAPQGLALDTTVDVQSVQLSILLSECTDWVGCRYDIRSDGEWAVITVNGDEILNEEVHIVSFVNRQDITMLAEITKVGEEIDVVISSTGDESFAAVFSVAEISFYTVDPGTTGGTVPMPEPSAALVFGAGLLVLSRRLRSS